MLHGPAAWAAGGGSARGRAVYFSCIELCTGWRSIARFERIYFEFLATDGSALTGGVARRTGSGSKGDVRWSFQPRAREARPLPARGSRVVSRPDVPGGEQLVNRASQPRSPAEWYAGGDALVAVRQHRALGPAPDTADPGVGPQQGAAFRRETFTEALRARHAAALNFPLVILPGVPVLAALLIAPPGDCPGELFRIARNTNANVVVYEMDTASAGRTGDPEPVRASWLMLAEDGRRVELNPFESLFAYGFEVRRSSSGLRLALRADPSREIEIREHHGCFRAFRKIAGQEAVLQLIFVDARGSGFVPSVRFVVVFGIDPVTGVGVSEQIVAPAPSLQASDG